MKQELRTYSLIAALIIIGAALASLAFIPLRILGIVLVVAGVGWYVVHNWFV